MKYRTMTILFQNDIILENRLRNALQKAAQSAEIIELNTTMSANTIKEAQMILLQKLSK